MLVGVGGSGKQSLARLASFICGYEVFQISVSSTYGVNDFKENLLRCASSGGVSNEHKHALTMSYSDPPLSFKTTGAGRGHFYL